MAVDIVDAIFEALRARVALRDVIKNGNDNAILMARFLDKEALERLYAEIRAEAWR